MKFTTGLVSALAAALCLGQAASAQVMPAPFPAASTETARLAGLCRAWGVVKYFHPALAYQPVDWDLALVQAIPKVRAAKTSAEYAAAVDGMLAVLHDPNTHVVRPPAALPVPAAAPSGKQPLVKTLPNGTAVISLTDYSQFSDYSAIGAVAQALQSANSAKALVFDLRRQGGTAANGDLDQSNFVLSQALIGALPGVLVHDLALPVSRHRMHLGYTPADGDDHGGYYSALVTPQGAFLPALGTGSAKRMAFIVSAGSADIHDILGGLQAAHLAAVIQDGSAAEESGIDKEPISLPDGVQVVVRLSETVNPNGSIGFHPDMTAAAASPGSDPAMDAALRSLSASGAAAGPVIAAARIYGAPLADKRYDDMLFPSAEYRLLALFRFWNIINYVYPYKDLIGRPWDDVLTEYIPQVEADTDAHAYGVSAAKMIAEIHDSHGFAYFPQLNTDGHWMPPISLREVQGQTIVTGLPDPKAASSLHVGDILLSVDGEPVSARRTRLGPLHAASTLQALSSTLSSVLLVGPKTVPAVLMLKDAAGKTYTATLPRTERYVLPPVRLTPVYGVLPSGLGYMDLGRLMPADVDKAFAAVAKTPGLIFDMRGYPNGTAWAIAPYLASQTVVGACIDVPLRQSPEDVSVSREDESITPDPLHHYGGKVAVLIDESAISQAEHTCLFLEAACHPAFVGTPTEGANGEVTNAVLPGGIAFNFTGMSIRHSDGRQLQRLGIQPTLRVAPTIAGLRGGRDEVLEAAVSLLTQPQTAHH